MSKFRGLWAILCLVLLGSEVLAGEGPQAGGPDQSRIQQIGLIIDLPEIRPRDLVTMSTHCALIYRPVVRCWKS